MLMTGDDLRKARTTLGKAWGWDRPVFASELGRAIGTPARDPGELIRCCEAKRDEAVPWYLASLVGMLVAGQLPPGGVPQRLYDRTVRRDRKSKRPRLAA